MIIRYGLLINILILSLLGCSCKHSDKAVRNYFNFHEAYQSRNWEKAKKYVAKKWFDRYKESMENDEAFKSVSDIVILDVVKIEEKEGKRQITFSGRTKNKKVELEGIAIMVLEDGEWKMELDDWHPSAINE